MIVIKMALLFLVLLLTSFSSNNKLVFLAIPNKQHTDTFPNNIIRTLIDSNLRDSSILSTTLAQAFFDLQPFHDTICGEPSYCFLLNHESTDLNFTTFSAKKEMLLCSKYEYEIKYPNHYVDYFSFTTNINKTHTALEINLRWNDDKYWFSLALYPTNVINEWMVLLLFGGQPKNSFELPKNATTAWLWDEKKHTWTSFSQCIPKFTLRDFYPRKYDFFSTFYGLNYRNNVSQENDFINNKYFETSLDVKEENAILAINFLAFHFFYNNGAEYSEDNYPKAKTLHYYWNKSKRKFMLSRKKRISWRKRR